MAEGFKISNDGVPYIRVRPDDYRPYGPSWASQFGDDPVISAVWTLPAGLTGGAEQIDGQVTRKRIGGFVADQTYLIHVRATTEGGQALTRSFYMVCEAVGPLHI